VPEYLGPDDLAAELADLRRRLHALETAPQSNIVSVTDGQFQFRTASSPNVQAVMGTDAEGNDIGFWASVDDGGVPAIRAYVGTGSDGLDGLVSVRNRDHRHVLYALSQYGLVRPVVIVPWVKNPTIPVDVNGSPITASGTYVAMWRSYLNCSTHVYHRWLIDLQAGVTSVAFKLTGTDWFHGGVETTIYEQTGITGDLGIDRSDPMPALAADGLDQVGELIEVRGYLRITGCAGNAALATTFPAIPRTA